MGELKIRFMTLVFFLVASCQAFCQPSFQGDWESGSVTGRGNRNWMGLEAVAADRFKLVSDGVRSGTYARVEVRSGDNPLTCCESTERAEVYGMQDADSHPIFENLSSGIQRYSFSVKFDEGWKTIRDTNGGNKSDAFGIFLQLHGPNALGSASALAFSATDQIRFNTLVGDVNKSTITENNLSEGGLNIGHWIDFVFTVKYAADNTGFVKIMRRDEGDSSFQEVLNLTDTPTLQFDTRLNHGAVGNHYWKSGLYRNKQDFTSVLYLDGMTRESVVAVPEPEIYTMMFLGLSLVGFSARRPKHEKQ
jgi:hypothetical protein